VTTSGGGIVMSGDSSGNLSLLSGATTVVAVTSAGVAVTGTLSSSGASTFTGTGKFATTIGVGNATPSASGSGITFPATQSASSDVNTLDDYEEGTWTATLTNCVSGTVANTNYVKVGTIVTARLTINSGTYTLNSSIFTLPFPCVALQSGTFANGTTRGGFLEAQASNQCYFATTDTGNVNCAITYITN
jgi:hypothetical protein